jgi:FKBP-type peptidyl-prolyl cis-trans isomerase FklB
MKMILLRLPLLLGFAALVGCATTLTLKESGGNAAEASAPANATSQQTSYNLGLLHLSALRKSKQILDMQAYEHGLRDALGGKVAADALNLADWQALGGLSFAEMKAANLAVGKAFLEQNKTQKGVIALPSGVQYQVLFPGQATQKPTLANTIGIMYTIKGIDGQVKIDTMVKGNSKMYQIPLQKIISKGWQEALQLMPLESKWRLFIPAELAFGEKGMSEKGILPNESLIIDTYLLEITTPK